MFQQNQPAAMFFTENVQADYERMKARGAEFTMPPTEATVAFFRGASLRPVPPGESKHKEVRYFDIREDDPLDEKQMAGWIRQAAPA